MAVTLALALACALGACASKKTDNLLGGDRLISVKDAAGGITAKDMYLIALEYFKIGDLKKAVQVLQQLETYFPFSRYALQAQLDLASAYYRLKRYDDSILQLERFVRQHGRSELKSTYMAYANYMLGLNHADYSETGFFSRFNASIRPELDVDKISSALEFFTVVVEEFPHSRYADSAWAHLLIIRRILAAHSIKVAQYYQDRQAWVGVINRCHQNLNNFPGDPTNQEALLLLREAWQNLGIAREVAKIDEVIRLNSPGQQRKNKPSPSHRKDQARLDSLLSIPPG